ncbi:unnamed protein product, partial [Adineta ricciae]
MQLLIYSKNVLKELQSYVKCFKPEDDVDDVLKNLRKEIIYQRKLLPPGKLLRLRQLRHRFLASLTSSIKAAIIFGLFTSLVILIGILTVCYTSPKPPSKTCKYSIKSEAQYLINADSHPTSIAIGDFNHDDLVDAVVSNSGSDTIGIFLRL